LKVQILPGVPLTKYCTMRYTIWYPQGGGGMWLNYLLWCNQERTTLPGNFKTFEFTDLYPQWPNYYSFFVWTPHTAEPANSDKDCIRLGGPNWFNFYLNLCSKKPGGHCYHYATCLLNIQNINVCPNLYWQDIIQNPEKFLADLSSIVGYHIPYDTITQRAIDQYINSCPFPKLTPEFQSSEMYTEWARAVCDVTSIRNNDEIFRITNAWYSSPPD
jgi:hypothetical protein